MAMGDVIVGVDGSDTARRAAASGARLAAAWGVNLHLVSCVDKNQPRNVTAGSDTFKINAIEDAEQVMRSLIRDLDHDQITMRAAVGNPAEVLAEEAEAREAQVIVVGNRRVQGLARLLGSVASDVLRTAPCDVLVAHTQS
jgi:nucleotide-binding universal stress UspA family protein